MKSPTAFVKPELLTWARKTAHLSVDETAKKITVSEEKLRSWESGVSLPTIKQLRKLAKTYKQSVAVFYLPKPPYMEQPGIRDYRRMPGQSLDELSSNLTFEIRNAVERREIALERYAEKGEVPPNFGVTAAINNDPEKLGEKIRDILNITYEKQILWRDRRLAFNYWRQAMETTGMLVFQSTSIALSDMRGFSLNKHPLPVIVVNRKDAYAARIFTMIHELVHIMLRKAGLCDLDNDSGRPPEEQMIEVFCNRAAGAALVPKKFLLREDIVRNKPKGQDWSDEELHELSNHYAVSREVILRRFLVLSLTDEEFYKKKREQFLEEYRSTPKAKGYVPPAVDTVSEMGKPFVRLILEAFNSERITSSDAADYLGVRLKHLSKISELVGTE